MHVYIRSLWMYVMWCGSRSYTSDHWNLRHFQRTHNGTQRQDMDCQVLWRRQSPPLVDRTTRDSDCYRSRQQPHGHPVWRWTSATQTQNSLHQGRVQEDMEVSDSICILVLLYQERTWVDRMKNTSWIAPRGNVKSLHINSERSYMYIYTYIYIYIYITYTCNTHF